MWAENQLFNVKYSRLYGEEPRANTIVWYTFSYSTVNRLYYLINGITYYNCYKNLSAIALTITIGTAQNQHRCDVRIIMRMREERVASARNVKFVLTWRQVVQCAIQDIAPVSCVCSARMFRSGCCATGPLPLNLINYLPQTHSGTDFPTYSVSNGYSP